ncbi:MAG: hypothetical protein HQL59_13380 [Magnetococcales bacterium]|nr:hypothetical protein [Magnetococcales bacterium]
MEVVAATLFALFLGILIHGATWLIHRGAQAQGLRQAAIIALNGEMERLYALYQYETPAPENSAASAYGGTIPAHPDVTHRVHGLSPPHDGWVVTDKATFLAAGEELTLLLQDSPTAPTNVRWLDRERWITARVSWLEESIGDPATAPCGANGDGCRMLTLFLDYPFRYDPQSEEPLASSAESEGVHTLVLRTIVGRRY